MDPDGSSYKETPRFFLFFFKRNFKILTVRSCQTKKLPKFANQLRNRLEIKNPERDRQVKNNVTIFYFIFCSLWNRIYHGQVWVEFLKKKIIKP